MERSILHCDMNNFYASVECVLDPSIKDMPVAVCGSAEERHGIVMARNYKAKDKGVSAGEPIWQAKKKCPDLVIVDYFECLEHESDRTTSNEFSQEGKTMRRFEAMVGELNIAMWIPSQGTKDSINLELVTMDKIGGSVKKAQIAHVIMSIARTVDDIANNKATIAILKNRAGKSGKVFDNVEFNNGTCRISTDNVDEIDSMFELKKRKEDELLQTQREIFKKASSQN